MHSVGRLFPRSDRAPSIQPVRAQELRSRVASNLFLSGWRPNRERRISSGFYTSQAMELKSW